MVCAAAGALKTGRGLSDEQGMTTAVLPAVDEARPAAWLVAGGIVGAFTVTLSCLVILV